MSQCLDDNRAAAFLDGTLPPTNALDVEAHIDACEPCRRLLSNAARGAAVSQSSQIGSIEPGRSATQHGGDRLQKGAQLGRYTISSYLGAGAMGVVYAAYDPQLDRQVAIKLCRARADANEASHHERLLREARSMAQLSHANVVTVHDAGVVDGQAFIAMQLVPGCSFRAWLAADRRNWRAIVAMMQRAGAGLAAAHDAQIIHRDFKPENVLVDETGWPRVSDFGLAREDTAPPESSAVSHDVAAPGASMTKTGVLLGTPAYMAPEQLEGRPATARSDQFAFCVTLYEAVFGERPFAGETPHELLKAIQQGRIRPGLTNRHLHQLRQTLVRGLAAEPAERYPTMHDLVAKLETTVRPKRRRAVLAAALLLVCASGVAVYLQSRGPSCEEAAALHLTDLWSPQAQDRVKDAFAKTAPRLADAAFSGVSHALNVYLDRWTRESVAACIQARTGDALPELIYSRRTCLDRRLFAVHALIQTFSEAQGGVVERAVQAVSDLPGLDVCAELLPSPTQHPISAAQAAASDALDEAAARTFALHKTGQYDSALAVAMQALAETTAWDDDPPRARLLLWKGFAEEKLGKRDDAVLTLRQAALRAEKSRDVETAVRAYAQLVLVTAVLQNQPAIAELFADQAEASATAMPTNAELQGLVERARVMIAANRHQTVDMISHGEKALSLLEQALGPEHPTVAAVLVDLGYALAFKGECGRAIALEKRALTIATHVYGEFHPQLAVFLGNLANLYMFDAHSELALPYSERAWEIRRDLLGASHGQTAVTLSSVGTILHSLGRLDEARMKLEEAQKALLAAFGAKDARLANAQARLGRVLFDMGRRAEAKIAFTNAIAVAEASGNSGTGVLGDGLIGLGKIHFETGNLNEAQRLAHQAATVLHSSDAGSGQRGCALWLKARVVWALTHDRRHAQDLAQEAQRDLAAGCNPYVNERREVAAFLAAASDAR